MKDDHIEVVDIVSEHIEELKEEMHKKALLPDYQDQFDDIKEKRKRQYELNATPESPDVEQIRKLIGRRFV